jgi:glycosyltransferase involved in cell wall biosynthesis
VAGYLGREHRRYLARIEKELEVDGLLSEYRYHGTLDRKGKIDFLRSLDVFSVPTDYRESKGISLLEAMASGVPAIQPRHGTFVEVVETTGGGKLVAPGDGRALADGLADLVLDSERRRALGRRAAEGVRSHYTVERMAESTVLALERVAKGLSAAPMEDQPVGALSN